MISGKESSKRQWLLVKPKTLSSFCSNRHQVHHPRSEQQNKQQTLQNNILSIVRKTLVHLSHPSLLHILWQPATSTLILVSRLRDLGGLTCHCPRRPFCPFYIYIYVYILPLLANLWHEPIFWPAQRARYLKKVASCWDDNLVPPDQLSPSNSFNKHNAVVWAVTLWYSKHLQNRAEWISHQEINDDLSLLCPSPVNDTIGLISKKYPKVCRYACPPDGFVIPFQPHLSP